LVLFVGFTAAGHETFGFRVRQKKFVLLCCGGGGDGGGWKE
jgi:hypothetical protein